MKPIVHDVGNLFDDRNLFLQVSLGLIAFSERYRRLVVRYGNHPPPRRRGQRRGAIDEGDPVVDLLLGIAAFSERGRDVLARIRAEVEPNASPARRPRPRNGASPSLRGLLE